MKRYQKTILLKALMTCIAVLMLISILPATTSSTSSDPVLPTSRWPSRSPTVLVSQEDIVDIPPGAIYPIDLGPNGSVIEPQPVPDYYNVMGAFWNNSQVIMDSVDRSPEWIREDLIQKYLELSEGPLMDPWGISLEDFDGDEDLDMIMGTSPGLVYYENQGTPWEFIFVEKDLGFPSEIDWVHNPFPAMGDIDNDGRMDIVIGDYAGRLHYLHNKYDEQNSTAEWTISPLLGFDAVDGFASPSMADLDDDGDLDIICGSEGDGLVLITNEGNATNPLFLGTSIVITNAQTGDYAKPCLEKIDQDQDWDLLVGNNDGELMFFENIGGTSGPIWAPNNPTMFTGVETQGAVQPCARDLDGDHLPDLITVNTRRDSFFYKNYGTIFEPQYMIWSTYEVMPGYQYYRPVDPFTVHRPFAPGYFGQFILDAEQRYVDEISFSIAHLSVQDLLTIFHNDMGEVLIDNAVYLYKNSQYLKYASIVEKGDYGTGNYYSTIEYYYRWDNGDVKRTIPRDVYYWYVAHPKISEEQVGYVNPNNGNLQPKAEGGRFWREYLFWHADSAYPPDPSKGVNYPKTMTPPLLKDKASIPTIVYDGVTYNPPGGHNNNGTVNNRPFGLRDHGIDYISNWVSKTLPLNQQEVDDTERPGQPVRIAHHHNGNCGELEDLTVSASRTCLVPAAGVGMPGEDHAWSEFWLNGWHQWDNYWSDGGGEIDNFYAYWDFWGGSRTGSGVYKNEPHCGISDVSSHYIPEDKQSKIIVRVQDRNGYPVDGARVVVLSHWLLEFGGDPSITVPVPNIYNYTDLSGTASFTIANRDISMKIVSKLGNAALSKTFIAAGEDRVFTFTLEGAKPAQETRVIEDLDYTEPEFDPEEPLFVLEYRVLEGCQYPPAAVTGETHPQRFKDATLDVVLGHSWGKYHISTNNGGRLTVQRFREDSSNDIFLFQLDYHRDGHSIIFSNIKSIETHTKVWYRITKYEYSHENEYLTARISQPVENSFIQAGSLVNITGYFLNTESAKNITSVQVSIGGGGDFFETKWEMRNVWGGAFTYEWDSLSYLPSKTGSYNLVIRVIDDYGSELDFSHQVIVGDSANGHLRFRSPAHNTKVTLGSQLTISGDIVENYQVQSIRFYKNTGFLKEITPVKTKSGKWTWSTNIDSSSYKEGGYRFLVLGTDPSGYEAKQVVNFRFENLLPLMEVEAPLNASDHYIGKEIDISGWASDDTYIESLTLNLLGPLYDPVLDKEIDITPHLDADGNFTYTWDTALLTEGWYDITVTAADQFGKENITEVRVGLRMPPDGVKPAITINTPADGVEFQPGALVDVTGVASDDRELAKVQVKITGPGTSITEDVTSTLTGTNGWRYVWDTAGKEAGGYKITAEAWDGDDNYNYTYITAQLEVPEKPRDRKAPVLTIDSPTLGQQVPQGTQVLFSGTAIDDMGIAMVSVSADGGLTYQNAGLSGDTWSFTWYAGQEELPGDRVIFVMAKDTSGKEVEESTVITIIDVSAPDIMAFAETVEGSLSPGDTVTIHVSAWDNHAIDHLEMSYPGLSTPEYIDAPRGQQSVDSEFDFYIPDEAVAGTFTLSFTAEDESGNKAHTTVALDLTAAEDEDGGDDDEKDRGGISLMWIIFIAALGILGLVFFGVAFVVLKRR